MGQGDLVRSPEVVQAWLHTLPYNYERARRTLRSGQAVLRAGTAHCLEAALAAATLLEPHGFPPLLLDLESTDHLDHVVLAFRRRGRWGAVGASRDVGLFGRRPVYSSAYALARSYYAPYVTHEARITGYALADLRDLRHCDWRASERNVWAVERWLTALPHHPLKTSDRHYARMQGRWRRFARTHAEHETPFRAGSAHWM